ncbi:MAG: hypothetical protein MUC91_09225 [Verrucomicrobia bacterium]|jgi:hypothetical protein|nr:hypothetical protein [Verrucomicrobiota bacterium]
MDKKQISLLGLAVLLVAAMIYLSRDWFAPEDIQIHLTIRPNRLSDKQQNRLGPAVKSQPYTATFFFERKYRLKSVKLVRVDEIETNRFAHPLWELTTSSNSVPTKSLTYGVPIRGMHPAVKGAQAEVLEPRVPYRLLINAGGQDASYDFTLGQK